MTLESDIAITELKERLPRIEMNIRRTDDLMVIDCYIQRLRLVTMEAEKKQSALKQIAKLRETVVG